eukprot:TRINITY_DN15287_c0_g1_i1.p1 TRINITY_DN15287_c0_g1~~TRINITY_DN15287_c0_g1_i1.p1  ORF type:complete len:807 (+),score=316.91 TRINITY_DN15287_c0_g1_i1:74-2422(+)
MSVTDGSNTIGGISKRALCDLCVECINSFNPLTHTVDSHTEDFLARRETPKLDEDSEDFLRQVFYGTTRYRKALEVAIQRYLAVMRRMNDSFTPLLVIGYLGLFRIEELGMPLFRKLISGACSPSKIAEFLTFLFTPATVSEHCSGPWRAIYDDAYVDGTLLDHIETYSTPMLELASAFDQMASGLETQKQQQMGGTRCSGKQPTSPKPFALSKTNMKKVQPPQETHVKQKYRRPVDDVTDEKLAAIAAYKQGIQSTSLSKAAQQRNREKEEALPMRPPNLTTAARPSNMAEMKSKRQAELEAEQLAQKIPCASPEAVKKKMEKQPTENPKLTTAALLREEAVFTKKQEEEKEQLKRKEMEMRDDTEFRTWQQKMQELDAEAARNAVALRKVEMMLADEEARVARKKEEQRKGKMAAKIKEDINGKLNELRQRQQMQLEENRILAAKQAELMEQNVKRAMGQMQEEKLTKAKLIKEEDKLLELKAAERLELDLQRKAEVIRQIRDANAKLRMVIDADGNVTRRQYKREFDPHSTMGLGTLNEMSLVELQQKLVEVRDQHAEAVRIRREQIESGRENTKVKNEERLENVLKRRSEKKVACEVQRQLRQEEREKVLAEQAARDRVRLQALQAKLQEKREQRIIDEEERKDQERKRKLEQQLKAADEGAIERKKWIEMERGQQNISKLRQLKGIEAAKIERMTNSKLKTQREIWAEKNIQDTLARSARQDAELDEARTARIAQMEWEKQSLRNAAANEFADKKARKQLHDTNKAFDAIDTLLSRD